MECLSPFIVGLDISLTRYLAPLINNSMKPMLSFLVDKSTGDFVVGINGSLVSLWCAWNLLPVIRDCGGVIGVELGIIEGGLSS